MDAKQFQQQTKPQKKLESLNAYKDGLFELRYYGYSYDSLSRWLRTNGLSVGEHTIRRFFGKYANDYALYISRGKDVGCN
ncbi:hypothetical protein BCT94_05470 [Vibrio breoganii]|uniref:Uncharacterized protein n=1 Tax=Vibrio breoganii TaxID=553239 RepID=A0AAP8N0E3_9VIBR|nr:hypothetical protein BCT94_05470 [Vibrio breoganii]PMP14021.1 hypothetical protein BCS93_04325 [Vibrio breoganii]